MNCQSKFDKSQYNMRHAPGKGKAEILVEITDEEDVFEDPDI
jgi:hypothetical protein